MNWERQLRIDVARSPMEGRWDDDAQDVMLSLASNRSIQDGAAPDLNRIRAEFPYFGEPYSKEEQKDVIPWHPRSSH